MNIRQVLRWVGIGFLAVAGVGLLVFEVLTANVAAQKLLALDWSPFWRLVDQGITHVFAGITKAALFAVSWWGLAALGLAATFFLCRWLSRSALLGAPSRFQRLRTWLQPNLGRLVFFVLITVPFSAVILRHYGVIDNAMWYMFTAGNIGLGMYLYGEARKIRAERGHGNRSVSDIIFTDILSPKRKVLLCGAAVSEIFALHFQEQFFGLYMGAVTLLSLAFFVALFVYIKAKFARPGLIFGIAKLYSLSLILGTATLITCIWLKDVYVNYVNVEGRFWPVMTIALVLFSAIWFARYKMVSWRKDDDESMKNLQDSQRPHDKERYRRARQRYKKLGNDLEVMAVFQVLSAVVLAMGLIDGALWAGQKTGQIVSAATAQQRSAPITAPSPPVSTIAIPTPQSAQTSATGATSTQQVIVVEVMRRNETPRMPFRQPSSQLPHAELQPKAELSEADIERIERVFDRTADRLQQSTDRFIESLRR